MTPKNEIDNRQSSLTLQKIGAHHSIDLALIPIYLEASLHHWLPGLLPLGRNLLRPSPADVHLTSRDIRAWHSATMQMHFATAAKSLNEVLKPPVWWRVESGKGVHECMLRTEGPFGWVKNDEACDGGVGLECHSGLMLWA